MRVSTIGLDIAKNVFQVHGVDERGRTVLRKRLRRGQVAEFFANLPRCIVGLEACGGAHYWTRVLSRFGHDVRLLAPQFVKPYVKSNKNDAADAEAICEAVGRPSMRFVPAKSVEQQDMQALHRIRSRLIGGRTQLGNQIRGLAGRVRHCAAAAVEPVEKGASDAARRGRERADVDGARSVCISVRRAVAAGGAHCGVRSTTRSDLPAESAVPANRGSGRHRPGHGDGDRGGDLRRQEFHERAAAVGLAGTGSTAAFERRQATPVGYQQARRSVSEDVVDSRRASGRVSGERQDGRSQPMDRGQAGETRNAEGVRCGRQQECTDRLGLTGARRAVSKGRLERFPPKDCKRLEVMAQLVRPACSETDRGLGLGKAVDVFQQSKRRFHQGPRRLDPHLQEAGYMHAVFSNNASPKSLAAGPGSSPRRRRRRRDAADRDRGR